MVEKSEYPGADIGYEFEPLEFVVTPELNQQYLYAEEDFAPIYLEETEEGFPIVHPALVLNISNDTRSPSFSIPEGMAGLHARDDVVWTNPARVGRKLTVRWKVTDIYTKRERPYKVVETLVVDQDGVEILRRFQHVTITAEKKTPRRRCNTARITTDTKEGERFSGKAKRIAFERLWTFSGGALAGTGWPKKNTHTDMDFARERGLRTAIASGTQFEGYVAQLMIDLFGVKWLYHGAMDVKFTGPVEVDDVVVARAAVTERKDDPQVSRFLLDVWVENQRGEKVLVGNATGIQEKD